MLHVNELSPAMTRGGGGGGGGVAQLTNNPPPVPGQTATSIEEGHTDPCDYDDLDDGVRNDTCCLQIQTRADIRMKRLDTSAFHGDEIWIS